MSDPDNDFSSVAEPGTSGAEAADGDYEYDEAHGGGDEPTVPANLGDELPPLKRPVE
ncbi:hypothetical protein JIG36_47240 [Actinoplanes sp. LDG1-06]|uniref:Uncharacterized protein n=1 Tax=Paractinoplanes ovalisporus TaxID=2810368 RepID=A0ABS2ATD9_9ACTN|nr:hypothetical protein [Actinoplanes ovalisporus]MBM2623122.1 hypothetical protein [Actinoplanes ovalisporus]